MHLGPTTCPTLSKVKVEGNLSRYARRSPRTYRVNQSLQITEQPPPTLKKNLHNLGFGQISDLKNQNLKYSVIFNMFVLPKTNKIKR